ncbi:hypothetical protein KOR34_31530 [Posidoniimonas corsicana]|uniref:Uncharacterized protein n=2 Tax=Posidoniimonas corsicana TaxID=1938618 RepID=A0A5C5VK42_9BACT|nr:hypothetical protein KOR34_31530 [Posidoniimonas corsicana]
MPQFTTSYLLKLTAFTAVCCVPLAMNKSSGFVWTSFLLPVGVATLIASEVKQQGEYRLRLEERPDADVEIKAAGGRYAQWMHRWRIVAAGFFLSPLFGCPALNVVDPEPVALWLPITLALAAVAFLLLTVSTRRSVLVDDRRLVTDFLLLGRKCWWPLRWNVADGDVLAVYTSRAARTSGIPEFQFWEALYVCRGGRRYYVAGMTTRDRTSTGMEEAAHRLAKLIRIPFVGYREYQTIA